MVETGSAALVLRDFSKAEVTLQDYFWRFGAWSRWVLFVQMKNCSGLLVWLLIRSVGFWNWMVFFSNCACLGFFVWVFFLVFFASLNHLIVSF